MKLSPTIRTLLSVVVLVLLVSLATKLSNLPPQSGQQQDSPSYSAELTDDAQGEGPHRDSKLSEESYEQGLAAVQEYRLTDKQFEEHIVARHGYQSKDKTKSIFFEDFDIRAGILAALQDSDSLMMPNTNGRDGWLLEKTFDDPIGTDNKGRDIHTIRVVLEPDGFITTAFPVK